MIHTTMVWVVLAALLAAAERADPESDSRRSIDARGLRTDVGWITLYLLYVPALAAAIAGASAVVSRYSPARGLVEAMPLVLQFGAVFLLAELTAYGIHRLQHTVPALWRVHSVHHSSDALRWWSAFRFHPLDAAMSHGVPVIVAAAGGASRAILVPYLAIVTVATVLAHADVHVPTTRLRWVVVTPAFHRSHHELGRETTNFALVLPICDVVFRTASFTVGARSFGSTGGAPRHGLWAQMAWGFGVNRNRAEANETVNA